MNIFKEYTEYAKDNPKGYWFKRKLYGWGWTPVTKEGWTVLVGYLILVLGFSLTIDDASSSQEIMFTFILPFVLLTATLIRICYKKGESPKWMWGIEKEKDITE